MSIGSNSDDVGALHKILRDENIEGANPAHPESQNFRNTFEEDTASMVVGFQEKYASEILKPSGLQHGTGYVGKSTRAKLNKLYGCGQSVPPVSCTKEGEINSLSAAQGGGCCSGLTSVNPAYTYDSSCNVISSQQHIEACTYCGNGVCGKGENSCNCPADCKTNTTTTPATCTDSDGGKSYYTKGTTDDKITIGDDVCDFTTLKERYCDAQSKFATESYVCPNGCSNGACNLTTTTSPVQKSISLISPNGGEVFKEGDSLIVKWKSANIAKVNIAIQGKGNDFKSWYVFASEVISSNQDEQSYSWVIPVGYGADEASYRVKVSEVGGGFSDESSNYFVIKKASTQKALSVVSPNGPNDAQQWTFGSPQTIFYNATGISSVSIYLWFPDGGMCKLTDIQGNLGKYTVTLQENQQCPNIPKTITAGQYKISVWETNSDKDIASLHDASDDFFTISK